MKFTHAFAALVAATLILSTTGTSAGETIKCTDASMKNASACLDAGNTGPKLPPGEKPPQFVLFTHDDAITTQTFDLFNSIKRCGAPATFFTHEIRTKCEYAKALWKNGDEIALHTVNHLHLTGVPEAQLRTEMFGVRTFLNETCGIPLEAMVGYRAPFLDTDTAVRRALYADGNMRYDSTYNEIYPSEWSTDAANRLWPHTEHDPSGPFKNAAAGAVESYPGMWSVPLNAVQDASKGTEFSMDPLVNSPTHEPDGVKNYTYGSAADVLAILKLNFDEVYAGSRAPTGVFIHSVWLSNPGYTDAMSEYIAYVNSHADARFVTTTQLINWLENPIPASQMPPADLTCRTAVVEIPHESFWDRTWHYWLVAFIICGPVLLIITVVGTIAAVQGCVRRRRERALTAVAAPTPTPLPVSVPFSVTPIDDIA